MQEVFNKTSLPAVRKSISAVEGLNMSIQGSNFSSSTPTQSRSLVTYQPVPEGRMFRSFADQKKKVFKAKHFPFTALQIGSYEYSCGPNCNDKVARVKILFSKKLMVYEFQLESPDGSQGVYKEMVEISVPFWSIISLWLYDKDMRVEVKDAPKIFLGKKGPEKNMGHKCNNAVVYNRKLRMDITDGQLSSSPYHYIQFKNKYADRIKAELREFDSRFGMMLRLPLIEDMGKSLNSGNKQPSSHLLDPSICLPTEDINNNTPGPVYQREENQEVSVIVSCSCTGGCSAETCQCCVKGTTCTEGMCDCVNCRNPLNILHQLGLPAERARTDPCLMENIYQIKRLDCYVKTQLILECCHTPVLLFSCIPGEIRCVNPECMARYKYSWCTARLLNEDSSPRNHCIKCGKCTDFRNEHCQRCNICYFAGESHTLKCPLCQSKSKEALDSSTDSDI
ncbi:uncharacterized protein LOC123531973 [Mercenaria mercenaria]|uniref:uncharacterized protein LOC123531973 n=1 Tax=Mercenaria mercenaria TaxID=6596 RepID=UPI00234E5DB1|nr:uncharacterized protein LOC123531973 [Mercenaria mercenaria]